MANNRPAIPMDVQRAVFVEAGHRCACCGVPFPLERAHIVPWSQSEDHSAGNLLCLCANCHEMADRGWDRETFFAYKRRPWVNRQGVAASKDEHIDQSDALVAYLSTADIILGDMSKLQRLLVQESTEEAESVVGEVIRNAKSLYDLGVRLRERLPRLQAGQLVALDKVYDTIAHILNKKEGSIFDVASALAEAKASLSHESSMTDPDMA